MSELSRWIESDLEDVQMQKFLAENEVFLLIYQTVQLKQLKNEPNQRKEDERFPMKHGVIGCNWL